MAIDVRPQWNRSAAIQLLVFGALFALLFAIGGTPQAALPLVGLIPIAIRLAMRRAWIDGDRLHARNFWRTLAIPRAEIAGFTVEDTIGGKYSRQRTVYVQLRDRHMRRLSATGRSYGKLLAFRANPNARTAADVICAALDAWLRTGA